MNNPAADGAALISDGYRRMQQLLHQNPDYGTASVHYAPLVADVLNAVGADESLDGRNAHLIQNGAGVVGPGVIERFDLYLQSAGRGFLGRRRAKRL